MSEAGEADRAVDDGVARPFAGVCGIEYGFDEGRWSDPDAGGLEGVEQQRSSARRRV